MYQVPLSFIFFSLRLRLVDIGIDCSSYARSVHLMLPSLSALFYHAWSYLSSLQQVLTSVVAVVVDHVLVPGHL